MSPQSTPFLRAVMGEPGTEEKPACASVDPELFFPNYGQQGGGEFAEARAKAVCRGCPLRNGCLEFALHTGDQFAIMGGFTPAERESLRRRQAA